MLCRFRNLPVAPGLSEKLLVYMTAHEPGVLDGHVEVGVDNGQRMRLQLQGMALAPADFAELHGSISARRNAEPVRQQYLALVAQQTARSAALTAEYESAIPLDDATDGHDVEQYGASVARVRTSGTINTRRPVSTARSKDSIGRSGFEAIKLARLQNSDVDVLARVFGCIARAPTTEQALASGGSISPQTSLLQGSAHTRSVESTADAEVSSRSPTRAGASRAAATRDGDVNDGLLVDEAAAREYLLPFGGTHDHIVPLLVAPAAA
ncbi:hypothetical protein EON67_03435 [archaeon]|nr:MAG: hypothetical protein EON67_03435 [archaeon]